MKYNEYVIIGGSGASTDVKESGRRYVFIHHNLCQTFYCLVLALSTFLFMVVLLNIVEMHEFDVANETARIACMPCYKRKQIVSGYFTLSINEVCMIKICIGGGGSPSAERSHLVYR